MVQLSGFFNPKPWKSSHVRFLLLQWQATCSQSFAYIINPNPALHFLLPPVLDPSRTIPFSNMSSALIKTHRSNAETYHGEALCKQKFHELLKELSLPKGLIRADIEEMGHHHPSGFVWLKQKKTTHKFKSIGKTVSYDDELTMLVEKGRITKLTGVASKEVFVWISVCEIYFDDLSSDKLTFRIHHEPGTSTQSFLVSLSSLSL